MGVRPLTQAQFEGLVASCGGSFSNRCIHVRLPPQLASIEKMSGFVAAFFSGSLADPDGGKFGQIDVFREEMCSPYGAGDRVKKYSWQFYSEPSVDHRGSAFVVRYLTGEEVEGHHAHEMADEFLEHYIDAPPGVPNVK